MTDARRHSSPTERNAPHILAVLRQHLTTGRLLEIAAGTGQHSGTFAAAFPGVDWQPTDLNADNFASISAWGDHMGARNLRAPVVLDAGQPGWSQNWQGVDAVLVVNLLHLISTPAAETVVREGLRALTPGGIFLLYGPFLRNGQATSDGDAAFDAKLRAQDPATGYKDVAWVQPLFQGMVVTCHDMPANNLMFAARKP